MTTKLTSFFPFLSSSAFTFSNSSCLFILAAATGTLSTFASSSFKPNPARSALRPALELEAEVEGFVLDGTVDFGFGFGATAAAGVGGVFGFAVFAASAIARE